MNNLKELYQDLILDHSRHPKNFRVLTHPTHAAEGINPICGDELKVFLKVENDIINQIGFTGYGCAISLASASLMTEHLMGKSLLEAKQFFQAFHQLMTVEEPLLTNVALDKLQIFENVKNYPMRIKCATLPWHTFNAALEHNIHAVTTEEDNE